MSSDTHTLCLQCNTREAMLGFMLCLNCQILRNSPLSQEHVFDPATTAPGEGVAPATAEEQEMSEQFDSMVEAASVPDLATLMRRAIKSGAIQPTVAYHQKD